MQSTTVKEMMGLPNKAAVYCFEGKVTKCFNRSAGENEHGSWSIESMILQDAAGDQVKLMAKDCDPLGWQIGTQVRLQAYNGDKGWSGLYAFDDSYKGEPRRVLKATRTCDITLLSGGAQAPQQAPQQQAPQQSHQAPQQSQQSQPVAGSYADAEQQAPQQQKAPAPKSDPATQAMKEARSTVMQIANLHLLCAKAVNGYEAPAIKAATGAEMSESQRQGATASIFIEACKNGLVRNMPTHPIDA